MTKENRIKEGKRLHELGNTTDPRVKEYLDNKPKNSETKSKGKK